MNVAAVPANASTLREWSTFLTVLKDQTLAGQPLLPKAGSPLKIIDRLEKQFREEERASPLQGWYTVRKVKRRLRVPGQLTMQFC